MPRHRGQPLCCCCLAVRSVVRRNDDGFKYSLCAECAKDDHNPDPRAGYCPQSLVVGEPSRLVVAGVRA